MKTEKKRFRVPYRKFIKQINGINFYTEKIYYKYINLNK